MEAVRRNTRQRQVILEELRNTTSHPTAAALYMMVRRRLPKISLGTVYRNLDLLVESGLIERLEFGGGEARFDGNMERHDHIRCVACGRLGDVKRPPLKLPARRSRDFGDFRVLGGGIQWWGLCGKCRRAGKNKHGFHGKWQRDSEC